MGPPEMPGSSSRDTPSWEGTAKEILCLLPHRQNHTGISRQPAGSSQQLTASRARSSSRSNPRPSLEAVRSARARDPCSSSRSERWEVLQHKHSDYFLFLKKKKSKAESKNTPSVPGSLTQNYQKEAGRKSYFECQQIWRAGETSPPTNLSSGKEFLLGQEQGPGPDLLRTRWEVSPGGTGAVAGDRTELAQFSPFSTVTHLPVWFSPSSVPPV